MSEKSMSLEQAAYLAARANYEAVNAAYEEGEAAFLRESGARTASGEVPTKLYMIDDLEQFERLSAAFERSPPVSGRRPDHRRRPAAERGRSPHTVRD